jgi:phosphatidylglycerophosphate synthase
METLRRETLFQLGFAGLGLALVVTQYGGSAALAFAIFGLVAMLVWRALPEHPHGRFGPANTVTMLRAAITAALAGLLLAEEIPTPAAALAAGTALALDGIDGPLARRTGLASAFGARFDMEIDALFVLVLAALLAASGRVGAWVLALGLMRYLWLAGARLAPALARPLPPSRRRRLVCGFAIAALVAALAGPAWLASPACAAALLSLIYSFGLDLLWAMRPGRGSQG